MRALKKKGEKRSEYETVKKRVSRRKEKGGHTTNGDARKLVLENAWSQRGSSDGEVGDGREKVGDVGDESDVSKSVTV